MGYYMNDALDVSLIGMNASLMSQYVKFCADHLLLELKQEPHYNVGNPFGWMDMISMQGKANFFERRVSEYSRPQESKGVLEFDEEF
jgi:ribonucleotide reductase beta subunit family protein with ferritin-like domain